MVPHIAYFPPMHGYYYYRPHNPEHVPEHVATGEVLGATSGLPYRSAVFAEVYAQIESEVETDARTEGGQGAWQFERVSVRQRSRRSRGHEALPAGPR